MAEKLRYFFYGLFMDADLLKEMGFHPIAIGPAKLPDYQVSIGERATLVPSPGSTSYGVVMELPATEATALYSKSAVSDYRAVTVNAILMSDGSIQQSLCYNLPPNMLGCGTNIEYAEKLSELVLKLGFSLEYANEITDRRDA